MDDIGNSGTINIIEPYSITLCIPNDFFLYVYTILKIVDVLLLWNQITIKEIYKMNSQMRLLSTRLTIQRKRYLYNTYILAWRNSLGVKFFCRTFKKIMIT